MVGFYSIKAKMPPALSSLEIEVTVIGGRNLVAKDRNMIGMKKKSDVRGVSALSLLLVAWSKGEL